MWGRKEAVKVRMHLDRQPSSIEGILLGRSAGHYRLAAATVIEAPGRTHDLPGDAYVPEDRVIFYQVVAP